VHRWRRCRARITLRVDDAIVVVDELVGGLHAVECRWVRTNELSPRAGWMAVRRFSGFT
jgi:hypothetical protein